MCLNQSVWEKGVAKAVPPKVSDGARGAHGMGRALLRTRSAAPGATQVECAWPVCACTSQVRMAGLRVHVTGVQRSL